MGKKRDVSHSLCTAGKGSIASRFLVPGPVKLCAPLHQLLDFLPHNKQANFHFCTLINRLVGLFHQLSITERAANPLKADWKWNKRKVSIKHSVQYMFDSTKNKRKWGPVDRLGKELQRRERYIPGDWHLQRKEVWVPLSWQSTCLCCFLTYVCTKWKERGQRKRKHLSAWHRVPDCLTNWRQRLTVRV